MLIKTSNKTRSNQRVPSIRTNKRMGGLGLNLTKLKTTHDLDFLEIAASNLVRYTFVSMKTFRYTLTESWGLR